MQYQIMGGSFPVVSCQLTDGEQMITERGSMVWMTPNMEMTTRGGGVGKMFSKALSGESIFQNIYTSHGQGMITFGSSFPGKIVLQKRAFLASEIGVELSIHFNKRVAAGFFGGEGFIMQRLSGQGLAFAEIDGDLIEYQLQAGQQMVVDTGNVAGFEETVTIEAKTVHVAKNVVFGGEGLFHTILTGPGRIWLQTMPLSSIAAALAPVGSA